MRKELGKLSARERHTFRATVGRFGRKRAFRGLDIPTILLKKVTHNGDEVCDHIWFTIGKWSAGLQPGDVIEFDARVAHYEKGYRGHRQTETYGKREYHDWKLSFPSKVRVLLHQICVNDRGVRHDIDEKDKWQRELPDCDSKEQVARDREGNDPDSIE